MSGNPGTDANESTEAQVEAPEAADETSVVEEQPKTFTQAELDRVVSDRLSRERSKFADYDDLRTKAARVDELETELTTSRHEATRARVQARHGLTDEDAELFLTGSDEASLTAQAEALVARTSQPRRTNPVPGEGTNPASPPDPTRDFLRTVLNKG
ncbi:hypothetical protein EEW87_004280 [Janibacter melonis]|uniref:DUF4355 domain-containing protein n=1 Tax=Janibacter melonis TaxID=262209 RepID=A0A5P8FJN5_9MICO|nr:hypothetical protein [Janibacter melonis]QFQ29716.2 hypothetical protein EEW87_004280 [Janibacter melonis]